jgi:hypothetical protein
MGSEWGGVRVTGSSTSSRLLPLTHIHRKKRCDLSLFQLGLRILEHFLNEELPIPVQFHVTI